MSKKISGCVPLLAFLGLTVLLINCGSSSSRPAGVLYYLSQGEQKVGSYAINLDSGALSLINKTASTCSALSQVPPVPCGFPEAIILDPSGSVAFVLNQGDPTHVDAQAKPDPISPTVSSYNVNSDGSLTATGTPVKVGTSIDKDPVTADTATTMAIDPSGKFLLVISQGAISLPTNCAVAQPPTSGCPALSVFNVQSGSGTLTPAGVVSLDFVPTSVAASISNCGASAVASVRHRRCCRSTSTPTSAATLNALSRTRRRMGLQPRGRPSGSLNTVCHPPGPTF